MFGHRHRQYNTKKSTVSHSETLPVASDNLPENRSNLDRTLSAESDELDNLDDLPSNRSNLDLSTLVPTDSTTKISEALFSSLPSDTPITVWFNSYHCMVQQLMSWHCPTQIS